jgi:hypothetical protein
MNTRRRAMADTMNRVDHFIWVVRPENIEKYVASLSALLNVEFEHRDGPKIDGSNLDVYLSWDSGLEIVAPLGADNSETGRLKEHPAAKTFFECLEKRGEGPYAIAFRVPNLEMAGDRARKQGRSLQYLQSSDRDQRVRTHHAWTNKVVDNHEINIGEFVNITILLAQTEYPGDS